MLTVAVNYNCRLLCIKSDGDDDDYQVDNLRGMLSGHISMLSANGVHHSESTYSRKPLNGAVNT